jgi:hypothetical protein
MTSEPKMSAVPPYQWVGAVVLSPDDVEALINELPPEARVVAQLQDAAHTAARLAVGLNQIEQGRVA